MPGSKPYGLALSGINHENITEDPNDREESKALGGADGRIQNKWMVFMHFGSSSDNLNLEFLGIPTKKLKIGQK